MIFGTSEDRQTTILGIVEDDLKDLKSGKPAVAHTEQGTKMIILYGKTLEDIIKEFPRLGIKMMGNL